MQYLILYYRFIVTQMVDDVMNIQDELLGAHNLSTSMSGPPPKPLGQPHVLPFDLNTSPIPATSPQSESPRTLQVYHQDTV